MSRISGIAIWAVAVGVVAVFAGSPAQAACEPEKVAAKYPGLAGKTLKVGLDPTLPPVMYRDPKDPSKIVGQDPDMIDAAMKCLGVKYELVWLDGEALCVTPDFQANLDGQVPEWLPLPRVPSAPWDEFLQTSVVTPGGGSAPAWPQTKSRMAPKEAAQIIAMTLARTIQGTRIMVPVTPVPGEDPPSG